MMTHRFFIQYVVPCISAVLILMTIRWVDTTFVPPITMFDVQTIRVESDAVYLSGYVYKPEYRASCTLELVTAIVNEHALEVLYSSKDGTSTTRPPGKTAFSDMRVPGVNIRNIVLTARHSCYGSLGWDHSTKLADIHISEPNVY